MKVILFAAQSLDGFIAKHDQSGTDFCSEADRRFLRQALAGCDSMIMGRVTFETIRERLLASTETRYLRKILTRSPERFAEWERPERIEFTAGEPASILEELQQRGRARCALLGGSRVYDRFLEEDLVDELWLTLEPVIFGQGTPLAQSALERRFQLMSHEPIGDQALLLRYSRAT